MMILHSVEVLPFLHFNNYSHSYRDICRVYFCADKTGQALYHILVIFKLLVGFEEKLKIYKLNTNYYIQVIQYIFGSH